MFTGGDIAIIVYGESRTGKSYTVFGPGFNCVLSETEFGILPRTVRQLFRQLKVSHYVLWLYFFIHKLFVYIF